MARRTIKFGRGAVMAEMPNVWREVWDRAMRAPGNRRLVRLLDEAFDGLHRSAHRRWPRSRRKKRRPTRSADALEAGVRLVPPSTVEGYLRIQPGSDAEGYAYFIRSASVPSHRGSPVAAYMQAPGRRMARRLRREIAATLLDILERD